MRWIVVVMVVDGGVGEDISSSSKRWTNSEDGLGRRWG